MIKNYNIVGKIKVLKRKKSLFDEMNLIFIIIILHQKIFKNKNKSSLKLPILDFI